MKNILKLFPLIVTAVSLFLFFVFTNVSVLNAQALKPADGAIAGTEDTDYVFTNADFPASGGTGTYIGVTITAQPGTGVLYIDTNGNGTIDGGENAPTGSQILFTEPLKYKPNPNENGANYTSFDFKIWDDTPDESNQTAIITVNINAVNDAPTSADNVITGDEDLNLILNSGMFAFTDPDVGDMLTTIRITSLPTNGTLFLDANTNGINDSEDVTLNQVINEADIANLIFLGAQDEFGTPYSSFDFQVGDMDGLYSGEHTMAINLNPVEDPPASADNSVSLLEDDVFVFQNIDFTYSDPEGAPLDHIRISTVPANGMLWIDTDGNGTQNEAALVDNDLLPAADISKLSFRPAADENGSPYSSFNFEVNDGTLYSAASYTMVLNVTPVNDAPSFTAGANQTVNEDAGAQTVNPWATLISSGPADEVGQALSFSVSNDNSALFSAQPTIDASGVLTYTPAADANGSATVTVSLSDDGGTTNGGDDTSADETFTITVDPVNDLPTIADKTLDVDENSPNGTLVGNAGGNDPDGDPLTYSITAGNTGTTFSIDAATGDITVNNPPDFETLDQYILTIEVTDGGAPQSAQVTIDINDINDLPPTLNDGTYSVDEGAANGTIVTTLTYNEPEGNPLTFSILSGNTDGAFMVNASGELVVANSSAVDFETNDPFNMVVQIDDGAFTDNAVVTVNINPIPEPPTFTSDPVTFAIVLTPYTYNISTTDDEGDAITLSAPTLPAWLSLTDNGDGTGLLSGTPGATDTGPNSVVLRATDVDGSTEQSFTLNVASAAITVNPDGTADYTSIQEALNNAGDGDIILVENDTYYENITISTPNITLVGNTADPSQCLIDGGASGSVITVTAAGSGVSFNGFTITNGRGTTADLSGTGNYSPNAVYGGGLYCTDTEITLSNVIVVNNSVAAQGKKGASGGGLYASGSVVNINDSEIKNNTAEVYRGGGICVDENSSLVLENVDVLSNTAGNYGGGISVWNSTLDMTNVNFALNTTTGPNGVGGALYLLNSVQTLNNVSLINNSAAVEADGVYIYGSGTTGTFTGSDSVVEIQ